MDTYTDSLEKAGKIRDYLPWVTVEEQADFINLLVETKEWIDEKRAE